VWDSGLLCLFGVWGKVGVEGYFGGCVGSFLGCCLFVWVDWYEGLLGDVRGICGCVL